MALGTDDTPLKLLLQVVVDRILGKIRNVALGVLIDECTGEWDSHGNNDILASHTGLSEDTGRSNEVLVFRPGQRVGVFRLAVEDKDAVGAIQRVARSLNVANVLVRTTVVGTERSGVVLQGGSVGRVRRGGAVASVDKTGADGGGLGRLAGRSSGGGLARCRSGSSLAVIGALIAKAESEAERGTGTSTESRRSSGSSSGGDSTIDNVAVLVESILAVGLGLWRGGTLAGSSGGSCARTVQPVDGALDGR